MKFSATTLNVFAAVVVLGAAGLTVAVYHQVDRHLKKPEAPEVDVAPHSIYIPSPVERAALSRFAKLWPETFNAQKPLIASKLPLFYRTLYGIDERSSLQMGAAQLAIVRNWSIEANTASLEALKSALIVPLDEIFNAGPEGVKESPEPKTLSELLKRSMDKYETECSLFHQERLFRIGQAWPQFQKEAVARYKKCVGDEDLLSVWFDLNELLFAPGANPASNPKLNDSVGMRLAKLQQSGAAFDAYLADQLSQAAFLKATH
ncbi:MAG TPA: hypothetical protein VM901_05600 [Bdellovibrionota bacterium]|nr:hypothetical protein [Bdellovibrionota bacterium]